MPPRHGQLPQSCQSSAFANHNVMQQPCLSHQPLSELQCLTDCRQKVCEELGLQEDAVELSMGMSNDFEEAVSGSAAACAMQLVVGGGCSSGKATM